VGYNVVPRFIPDYQRTIELVRTMLKSKFVLLTLLAVAQCIVYGGSPLASAQSTDLVPFHIPGDDSSENVTSFAYRVPGEAGAKGFVGITNGKFSIAGKRQRFWGVNLCFGANFPTHEEATKIAAHFRKLGINIVRFHHMDMQDAPGGIWRTLDDGKRELDPGQIDRLDFFLNELHKNGIYANLNLHVSRTLTEAEGFPVLGEGVNWWTGSNKWVMYYDPDVQRELKKYCRDLLTHKNPYRELKRVDDPGLALVEMLNENFFSVKGTEILSRLPKKYQDSFQVKWNDWLSQRYADTPTMVKTWLSKQQPMGDFLVEAAAWKQDLEGWTLNLQGVQAVQKFGTQGPKPGVTSLRIEPSDRTAQAHFMQLRQGNLSVTANQPYTLKLWVRADKERPFGIELSTVAGGEWRDLGQFETITATPKWQLIKRTIFPRETIDEAASLSLNFGTGATPLEIASVSLQQGAEVDPFDADQDLAKKSVVVPVAGWPTAAFEDLQQFMVDTERSWIVELKSYLKNDLGVKVPITASQENYHAPGLLADTADFIDLHNYWHHPTFPGDAEWSKTNWRVENEAIESNPTRSDWPANSLLMRTGWRYFDMPFTLSEWNQGEPNDTGSGAVMMAAIIGAAQDWDGIMFFNYAENENGWFDNRYEGWFDFKGHPVKQATLAVAGNIYLRGDLAPLTERKSGTFSDRLDGRASFSHQLGIDTKATEADEVSVPKSNRFATPDGSLVWDSTDPTKAFIQLNTARTVGVWGLIDGGNFEAGSIKISVEKTAHQYATIVLTSQDNLPIKKSKSMLLLASSGAENVGMNWNEDRTSVGANWGTGPTLINPVAATVRLPAGRTPIVHALDGSGNRTAEVPVIRADDGTYAVKIDGVHKTLWYEVSY
jgi:hypothetical protein